MAVVSWGAPKLQFVPVTSGGTKPETGTWSSSITGFQEITGDKLLENSAQLNTSEGDKKELKNEYGNVVDSKQMPASYTFSASIIKKKGESVVTTAFNPKNGVVSGNYAMRLIPEDPQTVGFEMRLVSITVSKSWSSEQGALDVINVTGLEPNFTDLTSGDNEICKDYSVASSGN